MREARRTYSFLNKIHFPGSDLTKSILPALTKKLTYLSKLFKIKGETGSGDWTETTLAVAGYRKKGEHGIKAAGTDGIRHT